MKLSPTQGIQGYNCTPANCHPGCALEVVDELLRKSAIRGEQVDKLLELRWLLHHRQDAESVLKMFCQLRTSMEQLHYLAFYRLRRWLENQIEVTISMRRGDPEKTVPLVLEPHCLDAVRLHSVEKLREPGQPVLSPKVHFRFRCATIKSIQQAGNTAFLK